MNRDQAVALAKAIKESYRRLQFSEGPLRTIRETDELIDQLVAASPQVPAPQAVVGEASEKTLAALRESVKNIEIFARGALSWLDKSADILMKRDDNSPAGYQMSAYQRVQFIQAEVKKMAESIAALTPSPAPSASPHQGADALREALTELVALKDLKDSIERWVRDETTGEQWPSMPYNERMAASDDYARRKPLARAAARAALAQHQAPQQGEQK